MKGLISGLCLCLALGSGCSDYQVTQPISKTSLLPKIVEDYIPSSNALLETDSNGMKRYESKIISKVLTPGLSKAQQGITRHKDGTFYMSENAIENNEFVSNIYHIDKDFTKVLHSFKIKRADFPLWSNTYKPHLGQIAFNYDDGMLYVPIMDTTNDPFKTAFLRFDSDLNFEGWIDTSGFSPYIDGIAFDGDYIWIDYSILCRFNWKEMFDWENYKLKSPSDSWDWTRYDRDHSIFSTAQGLQIRDDNIYIVPECDPVSKRTKEGYTGIAVYKISELISRPPVGERIVNYPETVHYFELPEKGLADHEAFSFIADNLVIISSAADGGGSLWFLDISKN